ncbi:MAG TPA: 16S rRNA (uracil(1498)-N(3))-methyltransferase [Aliidongia sp.]|nr:16S rRNA (uracil(1498)-N(3))-methyltransferase [Aliidongia sp.]
MIEEEDDIAARLHVEAPLAAAAEIELDSAQTHYLRSVLRLAPGGHVALFNGRDGEWTAEIESLGKHKAMLRPRHQTREQEPEIDLWLLFAPVKRARIDLIAEKATELGVSRLVPVLTRRTNIARVNIERLAAHAREAAEQTERLSVPVVMAPQRLDEALASFPAGRRLILCDETGTAPPIAELLAQAQGKEDSWAVLTGPEGGFTPDELDGLKKLPFVNRVGLGPRVLRADTAALAALAVFQALAGDWRRGRRR